MYQKSSGLDNNDFITDPNVPDPDNLPEPLGWNIYVRPYPINEQTKGGIILPDDEINFMNQQVNIGRVVKIGPCCWNRSQHTNSETGERFNWVNEGDFVSYPKHKGAYRKFKNVSFLILNDDEIVERLPDPLVFEYSHFEVNIPEDHLKYYNTVYQEQE